MEEKLIELIGQYNQTIEKQKTLWRFMGNTHEGHPDFVNKAWEKLNDETLTYKKEIEFLMSLKQI